MSQSLCIYCGSSSYGSNCGQSPGGVHCHNTNESLCMYCGQPNYGRGCMYAPDHIHKHGHSTNGKGRCRYCGSPSYGSCSYSPKKKHEH